MGSRRSITLSDMAYTSAGGHRLYYETAGHGFPILLHHGFTQSTESWRDAGWVEALAGRARVILFDCLGHGRSDTPHEIDGYCIPARAAAALAVAEAAGADRFDLFGFSLGGRVAFALAAAHPGRVRGLVIGGMDARPPRLDRGRLEQRAASLRKTRPEVLQRALGGPGSAGASNHRLPDPVALALSTEALLAWDGAVSALPTMRMPAFLFAGERDPRWHPVTEAADTLPNGTFHNCGDVDHCGSFVESGRTLPALGRFLDGLAEEEDNGRGKAAT